MSQGLVLTLIFFGVLGFAGAGVAFAVARSRELTEAETDLGMRAVTLLLAMFGAACTFVAVGFMGVFAFGGAIAWFSYALAAQRVGVFLIVRWQPPTESPAERRRIA